MRVILNCRATSTSGWDWMCPDAVPDFLVVTPPRAPDEKSHDSVHKSRAAKVEALREAVGPRDVVSASVLTPSADAR